MKNHLGSYECKLCLTLHNNEVGNRVFLESYGSVNEMCKCTKNLNASCRPNMLRQNRADPDQTASPVCYSDNSV